MILLINICKERLHYYEFVRPLEKILERNKVKYITRNYSKLKKADINKANKIIICGTSLKDNDFLKKDFPWIKKFNKPIFGICGGSHIIGKELGYKKTIKKEIGLKKINLKKKFLGHKGVLQVYHLHQYSYIPEVFNKDNHYATLFHPEVRNEEMIENFFKI